MYACACGRIGARDARPMVIMRATERGILLWHSLQNRRFACQPSRRLQTAHRQFRSPVNAGDIMIKRLINDCCGSALVPQTTIRGCRNDNVRKLARPFRAIAVCMFLLRYSKKLSDELLSEHRFASVWSCRHAARPDRGCKETRKRLVLNFNYIVINDY